MKHPASEAIAVNNFSSSTRSRLHKGLDISAAERLPQRRQDQRINVTIERGKRLLAQFADIDNPVSKPPENQRIPAERTPHLLLNQPVTQPLADALRGTEDGTINATAGKTAARYRAT